MSKHPETIRQKLSSFSHQDTHDEIIEVFEKMAKDIQQLYDRLDTTMSLIMKFHPEILEAFRQHQKENPDA